jgi:protein-tyrosine phosphatase
LNIVDIHNHLLPGVDDGSRSFEETLRHLQLFHADGVTRVAVSPHLFGWVTSEEHGLDMRLDRLEQVFAEVQTFVAGRSDVPELYFSQEILCTSADMARKVFSSPRPGVRGTRYALVEFGFDLPHDCIDIIQAVLASGRRIVISHPERFRRDRSPVTVDEIVTWKQAGAALQVNGGSVLGDYSEAVIRTAWELLHRGLADIISTDHHADYRHVSPARVAREIARRGGEEQARLLMSENTGRILDDEDLLSVAALPAG